MEATTLRGVATPRPMLPDEISAIVLLERLGNTPVPEIRFLEQSEYSPEQLEELLSQRFFPIEVGEMAYKAVGAGSAAEAVVINLELDPTELPAGETKLIELMALRNKNGHLNKNHMSIPRIFGNLYDLGYDEMDLIERFKDVVRVFLDDINRKADGRVAARDDASMALELDDFVQATAKCQFAAFTPGRYLRDLWRRGDPVEQIRERVSFWITAWDRFQEEYREAKAKWEGMEKFQFSVNGFSGAAVETNNRFIAKVAAPTVDIFINRRSDGHGAIMTRGRDLSVLSQELQRVEPGRWYYHRPAGHLINGGSSSPSELTLDQLVGLAKSFPPTVS